MRRKGTPIGQYRLDLDFGIPGLKYYPFLLFLVLYCLRFKREIKPSLKALKDLKDINNK